MSESEVELIYFQCFKIGSKLRVRVISNGYNPEANCQFPKSIRCEGTKYSAPVTDLSFSESRGKFFYRVSKRNISIIHESKIKINKIYEINEVEGENENDCIICMDQSYEVVMVPCGHYCMCEACSKQILNTTSKCPLCRQTIIMAVTRDRILCS